MSEPTPNMLSLALRSIKKRSKPFGAETDGQEDEKEVVDNSAELEQAMTDFANATSAVDRAAAFKAALELAK
jgi:hypothetical protein